MTHGQRYSRFPAGRTFSSRLGVWLVPALGVMDVLLAWVSDAFTASRLGVDMALVLLALSAGFLARGQYRRGRLLALSGSALALVLILVNGLSAPLSPLLCAVILLLPAALVFGRGWRGSVRAVTRGMATATFFAGLAYLSGALTEPAVISGSHPDLPHTLALGWLGWSFATMDRRRPWRVAMVTPAVLSGVGWMGLLGCLIYLTRPMPDDTGFVPITIDNALAFVLMGHALWLLAARRPHHAWRVGLLSVPLALISMISTDLGRPDFMAGLFFPAGSPFAEAMTYAHVLPVTGIALLLAEFGLIAASLARGHHAWSSALWGSGLLVTIAGGLTLIACLFNVMTGISPEGNYLPILMPVATGILILGFGLLASNPRSPWESYYRTFIFPAVMGLLTVFLSLLLWRSLDARQNQLQQEAARSYRRSVVTALRLGMETQVLAIEHVAVRLSSVPREVRNPIFDVDAKHYLREMAGLYALGYANAQRQLQDVHVQASLAVKSGVPLDFAPARKRVFDLADRTGRPELSKPLTLLTGQLGQWVVVPVKVRTEVQGYVVGAFDLKRLFPRLLATLPDKRGIEIAQHGTLLYSRGKIAADAVPLRTQISLYGQHWQVAMYPVREDAADDIPELVLLLGFALGGLLAVALRLSALFRERARLAEARSAQMREQIKAREIAQFALADSERNLTAVLESITDGVLVVDRQWRYTYVNPQAARMLDADVDSLIGSSCLRAFPDVAGNELAGSWVIDAWKRAAQKNVPVTLETAYDFGRRWYGMCAYPHRDGLTVYLQDISIRKRHERALQQQDAEYRHAQALAHLGSWELHLKTGELHWSPETCAIFGVERSPGRGGVEILRSRVHPDDLPALIDAQNRLHQGAADIDMQYRIIRPDGEVRVLRELGSLRLGEDEPVAAGAVQDITEQQRAEMALRQARDDLEHALEATRLVMDSAPDVILVLNRDGYFLQVSAAAQRMWGYAPEALVGESIMTLVHADDREATLAAMMEVVAGTPNPDFRNRNVTRDGRVLHMQWSGVWSAQAQCLYLVGRDHTDLQRAEDTDARQRQILGAIARQQPLSDVLESIVHAYEAHHPDALCTILLLRDGCMHHGAAPSVAPAYCRGIDGSPIGPVAGSCGTAAWREERVVVADIANDPLWADYATLALQHGLRACWSTPIRARDGGVLGTFAVYYRETREPGPEEMAGLDTLALLAGVAIEHEQAFQRLSESEQRFRSLFEHHPDGVFALDVAGRLLQANATAGALLGEVNRPGDPFVERFAKAELSRVQSLLVASVAGEPGRLEVAAQDAWGNAFPAQLVTIPIRVEGQSHGVFAVLQDQRELRHAQRAMVSQLALISAIADSVGDGLVAVDMQQRPTFLNRVASHLLGFPAETMPGKRELPAGMLVPLQEVLRGAGEMSDDDAHFGASGKRELEVAYLVTPVSINGQLAGAVMAFRDIAKLKAVQRVLQQRDRFFQMSQEVFCIADPLSGRFLQVNPAYARLLGYDETTMLAIPYLDLLHPSDRKLAEQSIDRQMDGGEVISALLTRMRCADGSYRWLEWNSITGPDGLLYGAARDTTARREADEALARAMEDLRIRNRELQDFAYVASHDLQEPLRKIQTFSDRLQSRLASTLEASSLDYLQRMSRAASRIQTLINDLLAYSRAGSSQASMRNVDLSEVLASVIDDLQERVEAAAASIEVGALPTLRADPTQMRQLLQNLLANALKFRAAERACRIRIAARELTPVEGAEGGRWELRVEDNGIGFDEGYAERIFAPFQRLHPRNRFEGTGIGLAIVRRIAERHGGSVRAEGHTGQGASFVVTLSSGPSVESARIKGASSFIES
ncbi:MAG: PAS domain S-box protein [Rhodanobacter sp.]|nr:MAG: PAS domain S-box protein [Rhodanobacter sp.]